MRKFAVIILISCIATVGYAQDSISSSLNHILPERYVSSLFTIGHLNQLDTYLSNEKYRGVQFGYISEVVRDSKKHPLTFSLIHEGVLSKTNNRADNGSYLSGHYDFSYAVLRKWSFGTPLKLQTSNNNQKQRFILHAGGFINTDLGFAYLTKSAANNPAQAYISANIGAQVMASYCFRLWKKCFTLNYEARIPILGLMFSPNYGQSYYEIFTRDNYDHNVVFTSIGTFQLRQQLSIDIPLSRRTAVRVGYLGDIRQSTPNNLKQHQWYNAAVIGVTITK